MSQPVGNPPHQRRLWPGWPGYGFVVFGLGYPVCKVCFVLSCRVCRANRYMCRLNARQALLNHHQRVMSNQYLQRKETEEKRQTPWWHLWPNKGE